MFGSSKKGAAAYSHVGVETGVMSASPHKLIVMLFQGAEAALQRALHLMAAGDVPGKGRAISNAIDIIQNGMRASLDQKAGGEIAANLDALYEYMVRRLLEANLNNSQDHIREVQALLGDLRSAWEQIGPADAQPAAAPVAPPQHNVAADDGLSPRSSYFVQG
jgi:flagellar protein FliS